MHLIPHRKYGISFKLKVSTIGLNIHPLPNLINYWLLIQFNWTSKQQTDFDAAWRIVPPPAASRSHHRRYTSNRKHMGGGGHGPWSMVASLWAAAMVHGIYRCGWMCLNVSCKHIQPHSNTSKHIEKDSFSRLKFQFSTKLSLIQQKLLSWT